MVGADLVPSTIMNPNRPDPLTQLERSHRRLEEAFTALLEAVDHHDLATLEDVRAFFGRQGRRHEEDEDLSLFPRLESVEAEGAGELLSRLHAEHRVHEGLGVQLDEAMSGRHEGDLWTAIGAVGDKLVRAYRSHIVLEEAELFPLARRVLTESELDAMRVEMDARRGK